MLEPVAEERRRGPLERFETIALIGFAVAALAQAILGFIRAEGVSVLLAAIGILFCGALWQLRARRMFGGVLAVPVGLFLATIGLYSAYSATNVPFVGFFGRFSVPLLLICTAALLLFAEQDWQFQRVPFALAAIAFVIVQVVLTVESRSVGRAPPATERVGGQVMAEMELIATARSHVETLNARDAAAITVTRWIAEDNTVIAFGTASGKPAAMRAEFRNGKIIEWQVYTIDGGSE